jgi:hypothetical protein
MRITLAVVLVAAALAACGAPVPSSTAPAAVTASPTTQQVGLLTQPPPGPNHGCMDALMIGRLSLDPRSGLGISSEGELTPVAWPNGYTAQVVETTLVLFDHRGVAVARLGDEVQMGGGFGADGIWYPCHGDVRVVS